ncbi:MAG TPA: sulfotransferase, partial [Pirellulaceae bacterium]|nr:sulfotransferase [Pirellulaceae bacterium]
TTLLHELLALDPAHRAPTTFECFLPGHFVLTERWLKSWTGFALPRTRWFDNMPVGWDRPQEEEFALVNLGLGSPYSAIAFPNEPPAEADYLDLDGLEPRPQARWEAGYRRFLQRLIAQRAGRLILKSPPHTCRVPTLVKLFPQAKFIYVVRDPDAIFPSTLKLWRSLYATHGYQRPNFAGLADQVLCAFAHFHARFEATKGLIPAGNLTVVRFEELTRDPPAMLRRLYAELDLGSYEAVAPLIEKFQAGQRDYQPNRHELASEQRELLRERWQSYYALHGYGA